MCFDIMNENMYSKLAEIQVIIFKLISSILIEFLIFQWELKATVSIVLCSRFFVELFCNNAIISIIVKKKTKGNQNKLTKIL